MEILVISLWIASVVYASIVKPKGARRATECR